MTLRPPLSLILVLALTGAAPAHAQFTPPWAAPPPPAGGLAPVPLDPAKAKPKPKPKPKAEAAGPVKAPGEEAVIDRSLLLNGATGRMEFERRDKILTLVKLSLAGEEPGKPGSACRVDPVKAPVAATPAGKPKGLLRYEVDAPGCKFSIDVLDGAVLVEAATRQCEFSEPACRVEMSGVWGPPVASLAGERVKDIEKARTRSETAMRANFKTLLARTSGKEEVKLVAREQAGFTSQREMICRDYQQETKHGYCASRITEARAVELSAKIAAPQQTAEADPAKKKPRKKPRPKPAQATGPLAAPPPM
ncbi:MAG: hypothetical protein JNK46_04505 [Methylobacteriaceae bacterium]|nr:hypothetical protein [Methylobacteriaceae bacterium]